MVLVENSLKNAYIGGYHEYEYTYDFTSWSTSDLQSKWWTVPTGSVVNSNGYYNSSKNWSLITFSSSELTEAMQLAQKLTMSVTWYSTWGHQKVFGFKHTWWQETIFYGDGVTAAGGNQVNFWNDYLIMSAGNVYGSTGTYTQILTVNFISKTWAYQWNPSDQTGTVTDTAIGYFRAWWNIQIYFQNDATAWYMKNFSIKIEY